MNFAKTFKGLVLGSALLLATTAFAASKGSLDLRRRRQWRENSWLWATTP